MNNKLALPGIAIIIVIIIVAISATVAMYPYTEEADSNKLKIVASFYPFYDIASNVAGENAVVTSLVPPGSEPHSFEASPSDILNLNKADMFIHSGLDFEGWEHDILEGIDPGMSVVNASESIIIMEAHGQESHGHGDHDPHYWVSPRNAITIAENIRDALVGRDPANKVSYNLHAESYIQKLRDLDMEFTEGLSSCNKSTIITTHAAFAYLGRDYGFEQVPILGLSPESEPSPNQIIQLIEEAREHELNYIFFEEMVDSRITETIAREIGAQVLVLNPVAGTINPNQDNTYIGIMKRNLENLKVALECEN